MLKRMYVLYSCCDLCNIIWLLFLMWDVVMFSCFCILFLQGFINLEIRCNGDFQKFLLTFIVCKGLSQSGGLCLNFTVKIEPFAFTLVRI